MDDLGFAGWRELPTEALPKSTYPQQVDQQIGGFRKLIDRAQRPAGHMLEPRADERRVGRSEDSFQVGRAAGNDLGVGI